MAIASSIRGVLCRSLFAQRLEMHNHRITGCRVKVIAPSHKHRHGTDFQAHIWLTIPPHENIVVISTLMTVRRGWFLQFDGGDNLTIASGLRDSLRE